MQITIAQAARLAGVTRQAIRKAVQAGKLTATIGSNGRQQVDVADVQRLWPKQPELPERIELEPVELRLLRDRLAEVIEDRDRWRDQAERLTLALTDQRKGWLDRLLDRLRR